MGEPLDLSLELDDFLAICIAERLNEFADLLHLQPQIGPQHDQAIQTRTEHPSVCRQHRIAMRFVKLAENPCKIACRIVDLHILPVDDRGDRRAGEQNVTIMEAAMHQASGERPQAIRIEYRRPA